MYQDKELKCVDCGEMFIYSGGDQRFYIDKGFKEPKRCHKCRITKKEKKFPNEIKPRFEEQEQEEGGYDHEERNDRYDREPREGY